AAINALEELTPFANASIEKSDYFPGIWETNVVDGKLYGVPWYVDTRVLFYRKDLISPPKTWAEWMSTMDRVMRAKKARYGILMPTNEYEPIVAIVLSDRADFLNAGGTRGAFESPRFKDAFDFYVDCFKRGYAPP